MPEAAPLERVRLVTIEETRCCSREVVYHDWKGARVEDLDEEFLKRWEITTDSEGEVARRDDDNVVCPGFARLYRKADGLFRRACPGPRKDGGLSEPVRIEGLAGSAYHGRALRVRQVGRLPIGSQDYDAHARAGEAHNLGLERVKVDRLCVGLERRDEWAVDAIGEWSGESTGRHW